MATAGPDVPPAASGPDGAGRLRRNRVIAMAVWAGAFAIGWKFIGLPTDPVVTFVWLWAATIAWNNDRPLRSHLGFARDWVPIVIVLVLYNISRGYADNGAVPHALEMIVGDRAMFGGQVPTVWLQDHLYDPDHIRVWDVLASWVYFSHFVMALTVAVVLWLRSRSLWASFMRRWIFLTLAGLATYFLYPAAPPWWGGKYGLIDPVARLSARGWNAIGLHGAGSVLNHGQALSNPVAAMPSLHGAFSLFVVAFFFTRVRKRWIPLLACYPLAMAFTLMYTGEHYMTDIVTGWVYVAGTFAIVGLLEFWWRRRQKTGDDEPTADPLTEPEALAPAPAGATGDRL